MSDNSNINMDDLFKRAAEDYPLRTDSADWDKVLDAMDQDDTSLIAPPYEQDGRRRRRRFLWLLLLLPLGGVGYYAFHYGQPSGQKMIASGQGAGKSSDDSMRGAAGASGSTRSVGSTGSSGSAGTAGSSGTTGTAGSDAKTGEKGKSLNGEENALNQPENMPKEHGNALRNIKPGKEANAADDGKPGGSGYNDGREEEGKDFAALGNADGNRSLHKIGEGRGRMKTNKAMKVAGTRDEGEVTSNPGIEAGDSPQGMPPAGHSMQKSPMAGIVPMKNALSLNVDVSANHSRKGMSQPAAKPATRTKDSYFYAGIIGAPDLSFVKFQSVKGVGYTAGILLGYNINRHLALETGLYFDRKKYYTNGEYFVQKNPPPNYYLENVNGACDMWEIPVNLRYNFGHGVKRKWFATGGLSTYLMRKEQYAYNYENISNGAIWPTNWAGKNPSNYLFSVINFSAGLEQPLGKIGSLRLEPYLRVPLGGFGKGSLPIMSTGLNVGIIRRIK